MEQKYSAGIVTKLFWGTEAKKTAQLFLAEPKKAELKNTVIENNIYQAPSTERATRMFGYIYIRLNALGKELTTLLANGDADQVRVINMISIMFTERLVFEFMYEVYRNKLIMGDSIIEDKDFTTFYNEKTLQSEEVATWSEKSKEKIRQTVLKMLVEAGMVKVENNKRIIKRPLVGFEVEEYLKQNGLANYLYALTGEK